MALDVSELFQFTPLREGRPQADCIRQNLANFNSRPSASGDTSTQRRAIWTRHFNSRPSARGDDTRVDSEPPTLHFNSRPSARGDRAVRSLRKDSRNFNSRPSARGDLPKGCSLLGSENFNSRPSARGDGKRYAISANLLFNPYKSAWLNNSATQFVEIILVIFHRIIV